MALLVNTRDTSRRRTGRRGVLRRIVVALLAALTGLTLVPSTATAQDQVLTWTSGNSVTAYLSAPETAVAGTATVIFDNSVAAGNTTGMPHTLTFDTSSPGYNHDVDLNITANPYDGNGGYYEAEITLTPGTYRYFCAIPGHGAMWGEFTVTDGGGDPDPDPEDTTPPEVSAEVAGEQDADGNYLGSATVTIDATDDDSGVDSVEYSLDGGDFTAYTEPVVVSDVGEHTVDYRAADVAGNSAEGSVSFAVVEEEEPEPEDTTAPEVSAEVAGEQDADGNYLGSATVTVTATDDESGVASIEHSINGGEYTHHHAPVTVAEPGDYTVAYRATDVAGNTAEGSVEFVVVEEGGEPDPEDTTPPEVVAEVAGEQDEDGSYLGSATVTITATDDDSGVASVEYSLNGGDFAPYTEPVVVSAAGEHTVDYRAADVAGNTAEGSVSFTVVEEDEPEPGECTDTRATVVIDGNDTGVANAEVDGGCINDLIDEGGEYASHGAFVRHVGAVVLGLAADGVISQREAGLIARTAAASGIAR